jgi:hypothetical protein
MSILDKKPVEIFDYSCLERSYKDLAKKYHPDVGGTEEEFLFLRKSYEIAKNETRLGYAVSSKTIHFFLPDYKKDFPYNSFADFCYGRVYVCDSYLVYEFDGGSMSEDLKRTFTAFTYADETIREKFNWQVPSRGVKIVDILNGGMLEKQFAIIDKHPLAYLLSDAIKMDIPIRTSVWIFNRLYALGCYMSMLGVYCLDIAPYNIAVNFEDHSLSLLGGWWHNVKAGQKMTRLPMSTYSLLSNRMKDTKIASIEIVIDQIKNVIRQILGKQDIPSEYKNWLSLPAQENIFNEYYQWEHEVMKKIFPERVFHIWLPKLR